MEREAYGGGNRSGPLDVTATLTATLTAKGNRQDFGVETFISEPMAFGGNNTAGPIDVATCLSSHGGPHGGPHGRLDFESETFVAEAYSIMPMNSGKDFKARETDIAQPLMAIGPTTGNQGGDYIIQDVAHTLRGEGFDASEDGTGRGTPLVPMAFDCKASGQNGFGVGDISSTMRAMGHKNGHQNGGRHLAVAVALRGRDGGGTAELGDNLAGTLRASQGGGDKPHVLTRMAVRRLTPTECHRLQGFPDGHTAINGDQTPDGPQYKALGNSMATKMMKWVGQRIEADIKRVDEQTF